jgi:hypothetical protein
MLQDFKISYIYVNLYVDSKSTTKTYASVRFYFIHLVTWNTMVKTKFKMYYKYIVN